MQSTHIDKSPLELAGYRDGSDLSIGNSILADAKRLMASSNFEEAQNCLRRLEWAAVDQETIDETDRMVRAGLLGGRRIIATCDTTRSAGANEHVVVYGNYPHSFQNLLINKVSRRHVSWFWKIRHDEVEYHPSWEAVDQIYFINKNSRLDRLDAVLNELAQAKAPLHRITRVPAIESKTSSLVKTFLGLFHGSNSSRRQFRSTAACLMSHIAVLNCIRESSRRHALVLEDDFCFTSDLDLHLQNLETFFARSYDYWICLLATSKYGRLLERDDLVSYSRQPCTNTAAYLVSAEGVNKLLPVWNEALRKLLKTKNLIYAADQAWSSLQPSGKYLVFRRKMGFQASSFSDIENKITRYFD